MCSAHTRLLHARPAPVPIHATQSAPQRIGDSLDRSCEALDRGRRSRSPTRPGNILIIGWRLCNLRRNSVHQLSESRSVLILIPDIKPLRDRPISKRFLAELTSAIPFSWEVIRLKHAGRPKEGKVTACHLHKEPSGRGYSICRCRGAGRGRCAAMLKQIRRTNSAIFHRSHVASLRLNNN